MDLELVGRPEGCAGEQWRALLAREGLRPDESVERTALLWDGEALVATGSRAGNVLRCIAVDSSRQGEGLTATVLTALRQDAFQAGFEHLFLYTKPKNKWMFSALFFYPVAQTGEVLLMENRRGGLRAFLDALPPAGEGITGAAVMNCNPFTRGHRYLIETAASQCDRLFVFVLSEDRSEFSAADRLEMVRRGVADLPKVQVLPTGPYLISGATFPTYFLKDREGAAEVQCRLDVEIFGRHIAPRLGITRRYVGTEPLSPTTARYNRALLEHLPPLGVEVRELPRLEAAGGPVSASRVRALLGEKDRSQLEALLPQTTLDYLGGKCHE